MHVKLIEGTNPDGLYLKAAICTFDNEEWQRKSLVSQEVGHHGSLLRQEARTDQDFWILDLSSPGAGGKFTMGETPGDAQHALDKLSVPF